MDKTILDLRLHGAEIRIQQVIEAISNQGYEETEEKLCKIILLLNECKDELSTW